MHQATLLSPSDNKPLESAFKSILDTCTAPSDNASRSGQQIRADLATSSHRSPQAAPATSWPPITGHHSTQATSWPPQQLHSPKTQQNQGKIDGFLRENQPLLMTLCPPIKKSIILLFLYCMHPVQLLSYCIYPVILYKTTVILCKKWVLYACATPPLPKNLDPLFLKA
jgi:hypothetical protein